MITVLISKTLNTRQSTKNIIVPSEQVIKRLKNNGKRLLNIPDKKLMNARQGIVIISNLSVYFFKSTLHTYFFIIIIFKTLEVKKHKPIAQTSEFIPIYFGKTKMQITIKIAPRM